MTCYFTKTCSICGKYGMVIAVILKDNTIAAQCEECGRRVYNAEDIGSSGAESFLCDSEDIDRAATLDDLQASGWYSQVSWEKVDYNLEEYFSDI